VHAPRILRGRCIVFDKSRYEKFFGPSIDEANIAYEDERERYLKDSSLSPEELDSAYKSTPDLEKANLRPTTWLEAGRY